jgi:hypothetical protein
LYYRQVIIPRKRTILARTGIEVASQGVGKFACLQDGHAWAWCCSIA